MNFSTMEQADREIFESAADRLGGFEVHNLRERMSDTLWQSHSSEREDGFEKLCCCVNSRAVQQAGCRELVPAFGELPFPLRTLVSGVFSGKAPSIRPRGTGRIPASRRIVLSLRIIMAPAEGMPVTQLFLAGLHRLARGVADLDPSSHQRIATYIPAQFRRHFLSAVKRLCGIREARIDAPGIRREWTEGR